MSVLLLRLAGPLQSWGSASRFARRETNAEPTKSGVLGLLAAALGKRRTDPIEELLGLTFGVRVDQPGSIIQDFHTARDHNGKSMPLTRRFYLSDALFIAGLEGSDPLIETLDAAVRSPQFPLFLGRRSCPPSGQVSLGTRENGVEEALRTEEWHAADWYRRQTRARQVALRIVRDARPDEEGITQRDVPVSFDPIRREYGWRTVVEPPPHIVENDLGSEGYHDPLSALGG